MHRLLLPFKNNCSLTLPVVTQKKSQHQPFNPLKNNRGVALLIAVFSLGVLIFIANEVSYESNVEYVVASQEVNRIQAYYSAKAGAELSLLRILLYKKAIAQYGEQLGPQKSILDPIWQFPFAWPPTNFIPQDDLTVVAREALKDVEKNSSLKSTYITTIESEDGKIDINSLGSKLEPIRKATRQQLLEIFAAELEQNEKFQEKYSNFNFEELVNNIEDWLDSDNVSLNGGAESLSYQGELQSDFIPPNEELKTLEELHLIANMTDDIYNLLKNKVTIYGISGINVNYAPAETLMALDPQITQEVAQQIIERRSPENGGLFGSENSFIDFLSTLINTNDFNSAEVALLFGSVYNFRIVSTGEYKKSSREITLVTYDVENLSQRFAELFNKHEDQNNSEEGNSQDANNTRTTSNQSQNKKKSSKKVLIPKGRPRIVFWNES